MIQQHKVNFIKASKDTLFVNKHETICEKVKENKVAHKRKKVQIAMVIQLCKVNL